MPKHALQMKATLNNVSEVGPSSDPQFRWYLKFKCQECGTESDKFQYMCLAETIPGRKRDVTANLKTKCKLCFRETLVYILKDYINPYVTKEVENFQTIVVFDCRGTLEPTEFWPRDGWIVKAINNGTIFTDVDLSEGEWSDYCEKIEQPVAMYDLHFQFKVL